MNCETVQENLSLYLYGELNFHDEEQFDAHLSECPFCQAALDRERVWHAAALEKSADVPLDLLASCRRDLSHQIDSLQPPKPSRWAQFLETLDIRPSQWSTQLAAASLLVFLGFGAARLIDQRSPLAPGLSSSASVAGSGDLAMLSPGQSNRVRFIQQAASGDGDQIEIGIDEVRTHRLVGRRDDPGIRPWIIAAVTGADDPSLRVDSVELLSDQPCSEAKPALVAALRDPNAGVRLKALGVLRPCSSDQMVQHTVLQVLATDPNPALRMQAIDFLNPQAGGVNVNRRYAGTLQEVVEREHNGYVKMRCERALQNIKASPVTY